MTSITTSHGSRIHPAPIRGPHFFLRLIGGLTRPLSFASAELVHDLLNRVQNGQLPLRRLHLEPFAQGFELV